VIGKRAVIGTCCVVRDGCVLVEQSVCPPLSVWEGNPGRMVGRLPDCWREMWMEYCRQYFKHFLPLPTSITASPRTSASAVSGSGSATARAGAAGVVATGAVSAGTGG